MGVKLKLARTRDPVLREKCDPVTAAEMETKELQAFLDAMIDYVNRRGYKGDTARQDRVRYSGMAANQFGLSKAVIAVDFAIGHSGFSDIHALINPAIIGHSDDISINSEGCRSVPCVYGMVPRFEEVRVKSLDRSGNTIEISAKGKLSVLLQHEIDHLRGILFIDRLVDPRKANFVRKGQIQDYRRNYMTWAQFTDVSSLVAKI